MKFPIKLATLYVLSALPFAAIAAEPLPAKSPASTSAPARGEPAPLFDHLDVNHDAYLTRDEARPSAAVSARFREIDMNRDGRIAAAEFKEVMQPKLAPEP